jgi:hypothetical protein
MPALAHAGHDNAATRGGQGRDRLLHRLAQLRCAQGIAQGLQRVQFDVDRLQRRCGIAHVDQLVGHIVQCRSRVHAMAVCAGGIGCHIITHLLPEFSIPAKGCEITIVFGPCKLHPIRQ